MSEKLTAWRRGPAGLAALVLLAAVACTTAAPSSPGPTAAGSSPTTGPSQSTPVASATPGPGSSPTDGEASPADLHLGGTITWTTRADVIIPRTDLPPAETHETITGTMQVVLLVTIRSGNYALSAERDGGSTYSYDYSFHQSEGEQCDSHETGTLEGSSTGSEGFLGDWSIGELDVGGGLFDDLDVHIGIADWCGPQMGMGVPEELQKRPFGGFPECPQGGFLTAEFDGSASYVIDCSYEYDDSSPGVTDTGSGQISGTLQMLDGPHPTPR